MGILNPRAYRLTFTRRYETIVLFVRFPLVACFFSMPFETIDLRSSSTGMEDAVCRTVDALQDGQLVVVPTETVYGLAALASDDIAVRRLIELKGRREGHPLPLAISGLVSLGDYVPNLDGLALRLARRCWPGPVSLVLDVSDRCSEIHHLPEFVRKTVVLNNCVSFRVPNHPLTLTALGELNEPVVLTSANLTGQPEATTATEIIRSLGNGIDLLIDDGPTAVAKPSATVAVSEDGYTILREGAVKKETIDRLTARIILFVCTGNTCRSPMAEKICEMLLAERLRCTVDQLEEHGFVVMSSGLSAGLDVSASRHAVETLRSRGLDLSKHGSQQINEMQVRFADHIFALTRGHREAILSYWPGSDTRLCVLRTDGGDINDPIGGNLTVYEECANHIEREIKKRLDEIL